MKLYGFTIKAGYSVYKTPKTKAALRKRARRVNKKECA